MEEKYKNYIKKIKQSAGVNDSENFEQAKEGTHHKVFLSSKFVIRLREETNGALLREAEFLKEIKHPLVPTVIWSGKIEQVDTMMEERLPGQLLSNTWRLMNDKEQNNVVSNLIEFLQFLRAQRKNSVYSVQTGKSYKNFLQYLLEGYEQKINQIQKYKLANDLIFAINSIIQKQTYQKLFLKSPWMLVHSDLIIHNLLADGKKLTGVVDWELALNGDSDYDLARLFYYQECARAYHEQGADETFETDFLRRLTTAIKQSNLIENENQFGKKNSFLRAFFYLNALNWAAQSNEPDKNIQELIELWNKK